VRFPKRHIADAPKQPVPLRLIDQIY